MLRIFPIAVVFASTLVPIAAFAGDGRAADAPKDPCGETNLLATTDRPTFGTNPCVVKAANAIFELGYTNSTVGGVNGAATTTYPSARIRLGLVDRLELVVDLPTQTRVVMRGATVDGIGDLGLGLKYELGHSDKFVYGLAGEAVLPSGSFPFSVNAPSYNGSAQFGYGIAPRVGVGLTLGFANQPSNSTGTTDRRGTTFDGAFAVGVGLTPSTKITAELAHVRDVAHPAQTYGDLFLQQAIGQRYLVDINVGTAFNAIDGVKRHYVGAGLAIHP